MEDTLCDLMIGTIDGSKLPDTSHLSAAAVARSQAKQTETAYRKLKVPDQIINEDLDIKKTLDKVVYVFLFGLEFVLM